MSSVVVVTGSAGLIGSESVRHFAGLGMDVVGIDNDMRGYFFGKDGSTKWNLRPAHQGGRRAVHPPRPRRPRPGRPRPAVRRPGPRRRAGHPLRRAAVARLGGPRAVHRLRRQRGRHAQHARGGPAALRRRAVHLHLDQQGLRRPAQLAAAGRARDPVGAARGPQVVRRHRRDDVDRPVPALGVRGQQGGRRRDGAGVRALLRHAHGGVPRRDAHRAGALRGGIARLSRRT